MIRRISLKVHLSIMMRGFATIPHPFPGKNYLPYSYHNDLLSLLSICIGYMRTTMYPSLETISSKQMILIILMHQIATYLSHLLRDLTPANFG